MRWFVFALSVLASVDVSMAADDFAIGGFCYSWEDKKTKTKDATVNLVLCEGIDPVPRIIATTKTNDEGEFRFEGLVRPTELEHDPREYFLLVDSPNLALTLAQVHEHIRPESMRVAIHDHHAPVKGRVIDADGKPVAGALVKRSMKNYPALMGVTATRTDNQGRFRIDRVPRMKRDGKPEPWTFTVLSPDHPEAWFRGDVGQGNEFGFKRGCVLKGQVRDANGKPASNVIVLAESLDNRSNNRIVLSDENGQYRIVVEQGNYHVAVLGTELVAPAITDIECRAWETKELQPIILTEGGWLTGRVVHPKTNGPVVWTKDKTRILVSLFGPSRPALKYIGGRRVAEVEDDGRFRIRVAPGDYYPYLINQHADRMGWDTRDQEPIKVTKGGIARCIIKIELPEDPAEIMVAAEKIHAALPKERDARVQAIIQEFRKLNHTVDQCDLWCLLMKDLIDDIKSDAVPALCKELESTDQQRMMRRLGFALRGINDPRAIPTLITVIPKTLQPAMSDYGLRVYNHELAAMMRAHQARPRGGGGNSFSFGRPIREVFSALHKMTGQNFGEDDLFSMHRRKDPRSRFQQEKMFYECAQKWKQWWEANYQSFDVDPSYGKVELPPLVVPEFPPLPDDPQVLPGSEIDASSSGCVLSPIQSNSERRYFLDLDTGFAPAWPKHLKHDGTAENVDRVADWAAENGIDLICIKPPNADEFGPYVLRAVDMKLWEIDPLDAKNIERRVKEGKLPRGKPIDQWIVHRDKEGKLRPQRGASFLYQTSEGLLGMITVTDFVIRKQDVSGAYSTPQGVGFNLGVRFSFKTFARK